MPLYHLASVVKRNGKKIHINWSKNPNGKAIVFIHGFRGSPLGTWGGFKRLFCINEETSGFDLIFYHYDSNFTQSIVSGSYLDSFLDELKVSPYKIIKESGSSQVYIERKLDFKYDRLVLVAHSLGGVVTRQAQLYAYQHRHSWLGISSMVFYAPAHSGARDVDNLARLCIPVGWLRRFLRFKYVNIDDLNIDRMSSSLHQLKDATKTLVGSNANHFSIARYVVSAENEYIVNNTPFLKDPMPIPIPGTTHTSVCKPSELFNIPFGILTKHLDEIARL